MGVPRGPEMSMDNLGCRECQAQILSRFEWKEQVLHGPRSH